MDLLEKESRSLHKRSSRDAYYKHERDRHRGKRYSHPYKDHRRDRHHRRPRDGEKDKYHRKKRYSSDEKYSTGNNLLGSVQIDSCKYEEQLSNFNNSYDQENCRNKTVSDLSHIEADFINSNSTFSDKKMLQEEFHAADTDLSKVLQADFESDSGEDEHETEGSSTHSAKHPLSEEYEIEEKRIKHDNILDELQDSREKSGVDNESDVEYDEDLRPFYPAIDGCRSVSEFQCLNRIAEGTYGVVYRFKDKRTQEIVALKKLKMEKEKEGFPRTSLREINTLLKGQHTNVVTVREIVVGNDIDKIFIVMDYIEHDLKSLIESMKLKNEHFAAGEVKCLLKQLLAAVAHLHDNWILHRDLKPANLLLSHNGVLKVGDFGLAREYGSPLKPYTSLVVTLWYRAPEILLGAKQYSTPIDIWSVGCIFAELLLMTAIFPAKSEGEQIFRIFKCLGTPTEKIWKGYNRLPGVQNIKLPSHQISNVHKKFQMLSTVGLNFLLNFLTYDPMKRITAEEALVHPYFVEFPSPIDPGEFTKWPARSEAGHRRVVESEPKAPPGGGDKNVSDEDGFWMGLETEKNRKGAGFNLRF